jgi:hypothetical protein
VAIWCSGPSAFVNNEAVIGLKVALISLFQSIDDILSLGALGVGRNRGPAVDVDVELYIALAGANFESGLRSGNHGDLPFFLTSEERSTRHSVEADRTIVRAGR